jgi:hypothetical protein
MKKFNYQIYLLLVVPLLLANSPSPYPMPVAYQDFTYTPITYADHPTILEQRLYQTTIHNTGEGYIALREFYFESLTNDTRFISIGMSDLYHRYIAPSASFDLEFPSTQHIDDLMLPFVYAYIPAVGRITATIQGDIIHNSVQGSISIPVVFSAPLDARYLALINLTIQGSPLTISTVDIMNDSMIVFDDELYQIAQSDINVLSIELIRGRPITQGWWPNLYTMILGIATFVTIIVSSVLIGGLIILFVSLLKLMIKKRPHE